MNFNKFKICEDYNRALVGNLRVAEPFVFGFIGAYGRGKMLDIISRMCKGQL